MATRFVKGSDVELTCNVLNKATKKPEPLTGFTGATAFFPQEVCDTFLAVTGTLLSSDCAQVKFELSDTQTPLLAEGFIDFEVVIDRGTKRTRLKYEQQLEVLPSLLG